MNPNPLESAIEAKCCDYAKSAYSILTYKFTSPNRRSVPDRLFLPPQRPPFFIEFKRKEQSPTAAQAVEIARIRAQGVKVFVVDSVEQGRRVIDLEMM